MIGIIGKQETLLQMFPPEDGTLGKLTIGIHTAIAKALDQQGKKDPTRAEVSDMVNECTKWAKIMRGDLKFGVQRIIGTFDDVLRAKALGTIYEPPSRQCWIPEDGTL